LINHSNQLVDESDQWMPSKMRGWWNCVVAEDFDKDGDMDFIAGNFGLNNQFRVSPEHPVSIVYDDFDKDGSVDPFLCYYIGGQSFPYASRDEALGQVPFLKQRFTDYAQYAPTTLRTLFKENELAGATTLIAETFTTTYFENKGNHFEARSLPLETQFSPVYAIATMDVDNDGDNDILMGGNESNVRVRVGKSDANRGLVLLNDGNGNFSSVPRSLLGMDISGDVRSILTTGNEMIFGINNKPVRTFKLE
jgi:hypothetical protein